MRRLILVTSPPACGKTHVSKEISKALKPMVYLDKDTLIGLSNQVFKVAGEENNRSSDFFEENIRNTEYEVVIDLALEALEYCDTVLINAPFTREIRDLDYMNGFRKKLQEHDTELVVIWVETDIEKTYVEGHRIPIDDKLANMLAALIDSDKKYSNEDNNPENYIFVRYKGSRRGNPYSQQWVQDKLII